MTLSEFANEIRKDHNVVCGCDEAGRGPLAGDVFAAAVIFDKDTVIEGINDSKKLTAKKREELFDEIMEKAVDFSIQTATEEVFEDINILTAGGGGGGGGGGAGRRNACNEKSGGGYGYKA